MEKTGGSDYLKECIADAILALIGDKPIEKITVDEIVKKAGVGKEALRKEVPPSL